MRVVGGILVLFNVYKLHSSYIRHEIIREDGLINNSSITKLVEKRRETIHKKVREATEEVRREAGDVYPPVHPPSQAFRVFFENLQYILVY